MWTNPSEPIASGGSSGSEFLLISTLVVSMSSSAQPVTGTLPDTVEPSTSVCKLPNGELSCLDSYTLRLTDTYWGELYASGEETVIVAIYRSCGSPEVLTETVIPSLSVPEEGEHESQSAVSSIFHVSTPSPALMIRRY